MENFVFCIRCVICAIGARDGTCIFCRHQLWLFAKLWAWCAAKSVPARATWIGIHLSDLNHTKAAITVLWTHEPRARHHKSYV